MANSLYDSGRNAFARGDIVWKASGGSTIKAILVDTGHYTVNLTTHDNLDDIGSTARVGTAQTLTLIDPAAGVVDANDISFTSLSAAPTVEAIVLYKDTGVESTSTLIAYIDTATGLPSSANQTTINVAWDNGTYKIFRV